MQGGRVADDVASGVDDPCRAEEGLLTDLIEQSALLQPGGGGGYFRITICRNGSGQ